MGRYEDSTTRGESDLAACELARANDCVMVLVALLISVVFSWRWIIVFACLSEVSRIIVVELM